LGAKFADNVPFPSVERYESRNTKASELAFRALLDSDGARDVSFRRVPAGYPWVNPDSTRMNKGIRKELERL
jgi:hypothetical protein